MHDVAPKAWFDDPADIRALGVDGVFENLSEHFSRLKGKPSPNLEWAELACNGSGRVFVDPALPPAFEKLRELMGDRPMLVTSAYRAPWYNERVGGALNSQHMWGCALDIIVANHDPHDMKEAADAAGFGGFGTYPEQGFVHVDVGPRRPDGSMRQWGQPFPVRETPYTGNDSARGVEVDRSVSQAGGAAAGGAVVATATEEATLPPLEAAERAGDYLDTVERFGVYAQYAAAAMAAYALYAYRRAIIGALRRLLRRFPGGAG